MADSLSRRPDHKEGMVGAKQPVVLFENNQVRAIPTLVHIEAEESEIVQSIINRLKKDILDQEVRLALNSKSIKEYDATDLHKNGIWFIKNGLIYHNNRLYVPPVENLRLDILKKCHDSPIAGHPGTARTSSLVQCTFWWPRMLNDIKNYVQSCNACQRYKDIHKKPHGKLQPLETPGEPWKEISMDHIMGLPEAENYNALLVVVDRFSKMIELIPTRDNHTSKDLADQLMDNLWKRYGFPNSIVTDRGSTFISQYTQQLYKQLGIKAKPSTAFHPQTDGQTEKLNHFVETYLRIYCEGNEKQWPKFLSSAQFAYNNTKQTATGFAPFEIVYGSTMHMGIEQPHESIVPSIEDRIQKMHDSHELVTKALIRAKEDMKKFYDQKKSDAPQYQKGDKVWLDAAHLNIKRSGKFKEKRIGPYSIIQLCGPNAVKLKLPSHLRIHPVINISRVIPYKEPLNGQPMYKPPPVELENDLEYEVDFVRDIRKFGRRWMYLVHWKGYADDDDSWEPLSNLSNAKEAIDEFHDLNPQVPKP